jgi:ADP-ribose pyrophosphatase YjhB (NUDIX family)
VCTSCGRIHFEDPKVAVAVLAERNGQVVLIRRGVNPGRGKWSLPAGYVEAGEDPRQAAIRELKEETGLEVSALSLVDVIARQGPEDGADILILYRGTAQEGNPLPGDDAEAAGLFGPQDLPELAFPSTLRILDLWHKP